MALQRVGQADMDMLIDRMVSWSNGNWLEMRAAAAGLSEPILLRDENQILRVLGILDQITAAVGAAQDRDEGFKTLCKGLGVCWSVAVAAAPMQGKQAMERWLSSTNQDVRWIIKEDLKKNRLIKLDKVWVDSCREKLY